jgi:hypothetical protein
VGLEASKPSETTGKLCLLVLRTGRDPIGGAAGRGRLGSVAEEPPGIGSPELVFLCPGLGWHR